MNHRMQTRLLLATIGLLVAFILVSKGVADSPKKNAPPRAEATDTVAASGPGYPGPVDVIWIKSGVVTFRDGGIERTMAGDFAIKVYEGFLRVESGGRTTIVPRESLKWVTNAPEMSRY
jgi:hypothetical protein